MGSLIWWFAAFHASSIDSSFLFDYRPLEASRGTKPPCWRAKVPLGQDKQRKLPFKIISQYDFCSPLWRFCTTWMASCKGPIDTILPSFSCKETVCLLSVRYCKDGIVVNPMEPPKRRSLLKVSKEISKNAKKPHNMVEFAIHHWLSHRKILRMNTGLEIMAAQCHVRSKVFQCCYFARGLSLS